MNYKLSEQTINEVLDYLSQKPYRETVILINKLQKAEPVFETSAKVADMEVIDPDTLTLDKKKK